MGCVFVCFPLLLPENTPMAPLQKNDVDFVNRTIFSQSFKSSSKFLCLFVVFWVFLISLHHNQLDDNSYLSDQLHHVGGVCLPSRSSRGWDGCGKPWTLHQHESAQLSQLAMPSADSCQLSLCLRLLWLILLRIKQRAPRLQAESHLLWRWEWGGFCVTPPRLGRERRGGGCLCSSEPRVRALKIRVRRTRKGPGNKTHPPHPFQPPCIKRLQSALAGAQGDGGCMMQGMTTFLRTIITRD